MWKGLLIMMNPQKVITRLCGCPQLLSILASFSALFGFYGPQLHVLDHSHCNNVSSKCKKVSAFTKKKSPKIIHINILIKQVDSTCPAPNRRKTKQVKNQIFLSILGWDQKQSSKSEKYIARWLQTQLQINSNVAPSCQKHKLMQVKVKQGSEFAM